MYYLEGTNWKITVFAHFRNTPEIVKKKRVYMVWCIGDTVTKLQRFVWLFNLVSRVIT